MKSTIRRLPALVAAMAVLILAAPPAGAATLHLDELRMAPGANASPYVGDAGVAPAACDDPTFHQITGPWHNNHYAWAFNASSTPGYLSKNGVGNVLRESFSNITTAHNNCGMADNVSATHTYLGTTATAPKCLKRDMHNVIGFHRLPVGVLAVTCYWTSNGRMVEADIQINNRESWTLSLQGCLDEVMLEATMTHEAGHVFGLAHVGELKHGRLTMSPFVDGPCQNSESTLGKGDILGLEAIY
jgi:Matrixin